MTVRQSRYVVDFVALLLPFSSHWLLALPATSGILALYIAPALYVSDLALVAFLITAFYRAWQEGVLWPKVDAFAGSLLAIGGLAVLTTPSAMIPSLAGYSAFRWLVAAVVYLCFLQGPVHTERFVKVFLVGLLVHTGIGLGQVLIQGPVGIPGEMALPVTQPGAAIVALAERNWLRAYGLTFHPNVLGGYLVVALLLGLPLISRSVYWLLLWWFLWGGLLLTFSRSATLAALVIMPIAAGWILHTHPLQRRSLLIALSGVLLIAALGGVLFSEQIGARLQTISESEGRSIDERQAQSQLALGVIAARPFTGVGAGNGPIAIYSSSGQHRPLPVHNVALLLASEVGTLGGALWIWLFLVGVALLVRHWRHSNVWIIVGLCAWFALWIISLFDYYPWGLNAGRLLSVTVLGLTGHEIRTECEKQGWI